MNQLILVHIRKAFLFPLQFILFIVRYKRNINIMHVEHDRDELLLFSKHSGKLANHSRIAMWYLSMWPLLRLFQTKLQKYLEKQGLKWKILFGSVASFHYWSRKELKFVFQSFLDENQNRRVLRKTNKKSLEEFVI